MGLYSPFAHPSVLHVLVDCQCTRCHSRHQSASPIQPLPLRTLASGGEAGKKQEVSVLNESHRTVGGEEGNGRGGGSGSGRELGGPASI